VQQAKNGRSAVVIEAPARATRRWLRTVAAWGCAALGSLARLVLHHRRPTGCLPLREEARLRVHAAAGLEQLAGYPANHAALDEYCRGQREAAWRERQQEQRNRRHEEPTPPRRSPPGTLTDGGADGRDFH
jgi:hypothetical protein